jgi:hypothetical protein
LRPAPFDRAWLAWTGLAVCIALLLFEAWAPAPQLDDAYISYRYARNLVEGAGLVYNPGERVEGYTNLCWTLLVAAALALGREAEASAHALGLASGALLLLAVFAYARLALPRERAFTAAAAPALVLASTAFARWTTSGMETPLFTAAALAALAADAARRPALATAAACVATLTRPDGLLVAVVVFGADLWRRRDRRALAGPLCFALLLAGHTLFRVVYYGSPVPNTFYAKVPGVPASLGVAYLSRFLADGAGWLLLPAAAAWRLPRLRPGLVFAAVFSLYVVAVGGDVFAHARFLLPVLAVLAAAGVCGAVALAGSRRALGAAACACLLAALWGQVLGAALPATATKRGEAVRAARRLDRAYEHGGRRKAQLILGRGEPVALVAATGIGSFGWHSRLPVLDLLGLVDATIARGPASSKARGYPVPGHVRSDADYVMARAPDYILMPREGSETLLGAHLDLWEHPEFARRYTWDAELGGYRRR